MKSFLIVFLLAFTGCQTAPKEPQPYEVVRMYGHIYSDGILITWEKSVEGREGVFFAIGEGEVDQEFKEVASGTLNPVEKD